MLGPAFAIERIPGPVLDLFIDGMYLCCEKRIEHIKNDVTIFQLIYNLLLQFKVLVVKLCPVD